MRAARLQFRFRAPPWRAGKPITPSRSRPPATSSIRWRRCGGAWVRARASERAKCPPTSRKASAGQKEILIPIATRSRRKRRRRSRWPSRSGSRPEPKDSADLPPIEQVGQSGCARSEQGRNVSVRHAAPSFFTSAHALPARFRADAAMFMHLGVFFAFLGAEPARCSAGVQHSTDGLLVRPSPPGGYPACDVANVCAVQVQADALRKRLDVILRQTGVGTGCAGLRAGVALLNAADERVVCLSAHVGMSADHLLRVHGNLHPSGTLPPGSSNRRSKEWFLRSRKCRVGIPICAEKLRSSRGSCSKIFRRGCNRNDSAIELERRWRA